MSLYPQVKLANYAEDLFTAVKVPANTTSTLTTKYSKAALTTALNNWWSGLTTQEQTDLETTWAAMDPTSPKLSIVGTFDTTKTLALDDTFVWRFVSEDTDERYTEVRQVVNGNSVLIIQSDLHNCPITGVSLDTARENITLTYLLADQPEPQVPNMVPVVVSQSSTWIDIMDDLDNLSSNDTPALTFKAIIAWVNDPVSLDANFDDFEEAAEQKGLRAMFYDRVSDTISAERFMSNLEAWLVRN
jgi:hypothetical protein